ncbi:hypothetical protein ABFT80_23895 [Mesorhizobium sp. SB112]|uniref:hypothetical protein n=1 Tax=Mesorhizobium sp. SB112 TaxID=3151853 RepID=UPI00326565F5
MTFIASTCLVSETPKQRPNAQALDFLSSHDIVFTSATLVDIQRGINRAAQTNPSKAADLQKWLTSERTKRSVLSERMWETARVLAAILECRPLKNVWLPDPKVRNPSFGHHVATAAAAIAYGLPIAAISVKEFVKIDAHFMMPGVYDVLAKRWVSRQEPTGKFNYLSAA